MRTSAVLVILGLAMIAAQVAFSDGARPNLISLPIGMVPVAVGLIVLALGLLVGLVAGDRRYQAATLVAVLGTFLIAFGLLFVTIGGFGDPSRPEPPSPQAIAFWLGVALWLVALVLGATALLQPSGSDQRA